MVFEQTGSIADQVWYRIAPDSPYFDPENDDRWIAVRMPGTLRVAGVTDVAPFVYAVGLSSEDAGTNAFCGNVANIGDDETITFTYDRQAAAEYAITHSYDRNTVERPNDRATLYLEDTNLPYAEFTYNTQGGAEGTFSTVFISESLWAGGMPMMLGIEDNCDFTVQSNAGWRYCSAVETGSQPWNLHKALGVVFTTGFFPIPEYSIVSDLIADGTKGTQVIFQNLPSSSSQYIDPRPDLEQQLLISLTDGGDETFNSSGLNTFARTHLADIQMGDYMWIYPQGETPHGLLVVGWQEPRTCFEVVSTRTDPTFQLADFYISAQNAPGSDLLVPYVADLTTVHSPMPRPFYCTWYLQKMKRPPFLSSVYTGFSDHFMRFYTLPNEIIVGSAEGRTYADPNWAWKRAE